MPVDAYPFFSRLLHRLVIGYPLVAEAIHDMEVTLYGRNLPEKSPENHVFVCGLARAGTTILMRQLYETGSFVSLNYRDMPFVLAPNFWRRLNAASLKQKQAEERAHGDGLLVDYDSPEALEEVFWRVFCGRDYLRADTLIPMEADEDVRAQFRRYVALILRDTPNARYLSKNNNNLLRLGSLSAAFPEAHILLPFRHPLSHAASLWRQHRHFSEEQAGDPFMRNYMTWLAHHEFGLDHRPFCFEGSPEFSANVDTLDYWLQRWLDAHKYMLTHKPPRGLFLCYESLCSDGGVTWRALLAQLQVTPANGESVWRLGRSEAVPSEANPKLVEEAETVYQNLVEASFGRP